MKKEQYIFIIVILIGITYFFFIKPYQQDKSFCIKTVKYNPSSNSSLGSTGDHYSYFGSTFKTYKEATDYCLEKAKNYRD